jgi:hypothetical protein
VSERANDIFEPPHCAHPSPILAPLISFRRDLATATQLTQYKGNNSAPNCFCTVGSDYFASAQASKDTVHFYAFHKVRRLPPRAAAAADRRLPPLHTK